MKKIFFLELNDNSYGGVSKVNFAFADALKNRYEVSLLYLRSFDKDIVHPDNVGHFTVRQKEWHFTEFIKIKEAIKKLRLFSAISLIFARIKDEIEYSADITKMRKYIIANKPDRLIVSHYLLLDAIPKEYLPNTYFHAHTSLDATLSQKAGAKKLFEYNGKINYIFLSENILKKAKSFGFINAHYLYNPISLDELPISEKQNKIVVVSRLSAEKRIDEMIKTAIPILDRHPEWSLEIYGDGEEEAKISAVIPSATRIYLKGRTDEPLKAFSEAKLSLNTSLFEGFSISVLEADSLGVPTLSFVFGEAAEEEILNGKTGILVPMDDWDAFAENLENLISDPDLLKELSGNAKAFAKSFDIGSKSLDLIKILFPEN